MTASLATRIAAAQKAGRTRRQMQAARGEQPHCSACGGPRETSHCYCHRCRAAYMRNWRKTSRRDVSRVTSPMIAGFLADAA